MKAGQFLRSMLPVKRCFAAAQTAVWSGPRTSFTAWAHQLSSLFLTNSIV